MLRRQATPRRSSIFSFWCGWSGSEMQAMPGEILQGEYLCCRLKHSEECFRHVQPVRQNSFIYCYFLPWAFPPLGAPRRCARSDAATSFSFFVDFGSLRILPASDAAFLPVVI